MQSQYAARCIHAMVVSRGASEDQVRFFVSVLSVQKEHDSSEISPCCCLGILRGYVSQRNYDCRVVIGDGRAGNHWDISDPGRGKRAFAIL